MKEYTPGEVAVFVINWLNATGEQATITGTPTITIDKYTPSSGWSNIVNEASMTNKSGSTYYYEYDTTGQTEEFDYLITYKAVIDGLNVETTEEFRLVNLPASNFGNQRIDFTIATSANSTRNVEVGMLDYQTIYLKDDSDTDWSSPISTKILYFWYDASGNCIAVKESD